jgi:luciferase family oxidoreductase group 1
MDCLMALPPLSILDLAYVCRGATPAEALRNALDLARHAEGWGYHRYWLAEHHNMTGIASAATSVVIGFVAGGTKTIRVGAGGIMLPNHSPMVIAEQFGTLESLYPGRIDLGVGRAPGTDPRTLGVLRRQAATADAFARDIEELELLFSPLLPGRVVQAVPGTGLKVPIWVLGSSLAGAQIAAAFGLPYVFGAQFAPAKMDEALRTYRTGFKPSERLKAPYVMVGINVVAADSDAEAVHLFTSMQQSYTNIVRWASGQLPPPIDNMESYWSADEKVRVSDMLAKSFVGSPETVRRGLGALVEETGADELMIATGVFDHSLRLRSYELLSQIK